MSPQRSLQGEQMGSEQLGAGSCSWEHPLHRKTQSGGNQTHQIPLNDTKMTTCAEPLVTQKLMPLMLCSKSLWAKRKDTLCVSKAKNLSLGHTESESFSCIRQDRCYRKKGN